MIKDINRYCNRISKDNPFSVQINGHEMFFLGKPTCPMMQILDKYSVLSTLYTSTLALQKRIDFSVKNAHGLIISMENQEVFGEFEAPGDIEDFSYFHIENALFRIDSLWDVLAQICNTKYSLGIDPSRVYATRVFSTKKKYLAEYWNGHMPDQVRQIVDYVEETDCEGPDGEAKGNFTFMRTLRNDMTHKYAISEPAFSNYAYKAKLHPMDILERLCENYYEVITFLMKEYSTATEEHV